MSTAASATSFVSAPPGLWFTGVSVVGLAWNLFGALQFVRSLTSDEAGLIASGMTADQAAVMTGFPGWVTLVFGVGVVASLVGGAMMLLRNHLAGRVMGVSLVAFVLLWVAYAVFGAFSAFGTPQIAIMTTVVVVALGLYAACRPLRAGSAV